MENALAVKNQTSSELVLTCRFQFQPSRQTSKLFLTLSRACGAAVATAMLAAATATADGVDGIVLGADGKALERV